MDLAALRRKQATVQVDFDDERLMITYNPHEYDDECQRILHDLTEQADNSGLSKLFGRLIKSWDLKDGGKEVPCTVDGFMRLPSFLRTKIINVLIEDEMEVGKLRASDNSSNQAAPAVRRSALVPIGTSNGSTSSGQD
jgi:hypothetical protein